MECYGTIVETISGQVYAYNTATNQIITIDKSWYENISGSYCDEKVFEALADRDMVVGEIPNEIEWPLNREAYLKIVDEAIPSLILEVTQECSLNCQYCIYSGNYRGVRTHSNTHMDWKMLKRCIDFYAGHSKKIDDIHISFYGGEALLRFDLIKTAVTYAQKVFYGKRLSFRISSNGTTLTEPILQWLEKNDDVNITVTMNGFAHDKYRVFPSGEGSLEAITSMLLNAKKNHPKVWDRIQFIANVASLQELLDVRKYYIDYIEKPPILITGILESGGNDVIKKIVNAEDSDFAVNQVRCLLYEQMDEYILPYYITELSEIAARLIGRRNAKCIETAACMPFTSSLFISAKGEFGVCERAGIYGKLGNIYEGINKEYIQMLLEEVLEVLNTRCRKCWCQRLCTMCIKDMQIMQNGKFNLPVEYCKSMRMNIKDNIRVFCGIIEKNPQAMNQFLGKKYTG